MKKHRQASLQRDAFLFCLSQTGNFTISADFAGLSSGELRLQADEDIGFAKAIHNAFREACDRLVYVAYERAVNGVVVPQFYQGEEIGFTQKPSDNVLRFLLDRAGQDDRQSGDDAQDEVNFERLRATLGKRMARFVSEDGTSTNANMDSTSKP